MGEITPLLIDAFIWLAFLILWLIASPFVHKTKSRENWLFRMWHIVPLYFGLFLMFAKRSVGPLDYRIYSNNAIGWLGTLVTGAGVLFAIWARATIGRYWDGFVTLKQNHKLIRTGPYTITRHPIYTGMIAGTFGTAISAARVDAWVGFAIVALSLLLKSRREECLLTGEFGDEYLRYKHKVPALFPLGWLSPAANQPIPSPAFQKAVFQSDRYRIIGMLCVCGGWMLLDFAEVLAEPRLKRRYLMFISWWGILAAYEIALLLFANASKRKGRPIRLWVWSLNTAFECLLPSLAIFGLTGDKSYLGPYRALVSTTVAIYFLLIILSTLRLSPLLCLIAGAVCSLGYLGVYWLTEWLAPHNDYRYFMPQRTYVFYPVLIAIAGLLAASVAQRIRRHVIAALNEAETRRALDRIEYDLSIARSIQTGLLPKTPPAIPGYDIAGWSLPAQQTGGDFYDWLELPNAKWMFTIADVTGHGIGPALLAASCRACFRAVAATENSSHRIVHRAGALLSADIPDTRFITAAVALLDPRQHQLQLYSAGHAPLYLFTACNNQVTALDADEPPLGISANTDGDSSTMRTIPLFPGDALILVTDGFFECANPADEMLGTARLAELIHADRIDSAELCIARLHHHVQQFSQGVPQTDDLTAVIIKRKA